MLCYNAKCPPLVVVDPLWNEHGPKLRVKETHTRDLLLSSDPTIPERHRRAQGPKQKAEGEAKRFCASLRGSGCLCCTNLFDNSARPAAHGGGCPPYVNVRTAMSSASNLIALFLFMRLITWGWESSFPPARSRHKSSSMGLWPVCAHAMLSFLACFVMPVCLFCRRAMLRLVLLAMPALLVMPASCASRSLCRAALRTWNQSRIRRRCVFDDNASYF